MVPSTPIGPPRQNKPDGWGWDFRGQAGPGPTRPPYTMAAGADVQGYFNGPSYPKSAEQFRGQNPGPLTGG